MSDRDSQESCVYLTIYRGNKLPPFYIGSTFTWKIDAGYHGSASSKKYREIWKHEIKHNPHLFNTKIIAYFQDRHSAILKEEKLQKLLNVATSPMYINQGYACKAFAKGTKKSKETRKKMSESKKGWNPSAKTRKAMSESGKMRKPMSDATKLKLSIMSRNMSQETRDKLSHASSNRSEEVRRKLSESHIGIRCKEETKIKISKANANPTDEIRRKKSVGVRAVRQSKVFEILMPDGTVSSWLSLEDVFVIYKITPTSLRRTFKYRRPIKYGVNKGWQLIGVSEKPLQHSWFIYNSRFKLEQCPKSKITQ